MTQVLAIYGSPRQKSNSNHLVEYILHGIRSIQGDVEIQHIYLREKEIQHCIACDGCHRKPGCVIKDEMQELYPAFDRADLVIVASPIYFNSVSALLKSMIDRCQAIWASKYILKAPIIDRSKRRLGVFVAAAGNPAEFAEFSPAERVIDLFFKAINTEYFAHLFADHTDAQPVTSRPELLEEAFQLGVNFLSAYRKG